MLRTCLPFALAYFSACLTCLPTGRAQEESYPIPAEAEKQEGVPEGVVHGPFEFTSRIYPGTQRQYWVYVPAQYSADQPACSMIVQDGLGRARGWRLPQIMDNLIHAREMPVTVGIFVSPGVVPAAESGQQPRYNRSFEYDSLGDRYARFLLEEIIPEVSQNYNLSTNPNDRALAGASSGGICAFNAAWERPDAFRRVISTIGTFVGLRGGNELSKLVRKTEPKPLRVFLQDGSSDLNIYAGDWWTANQDMLSALQWAGYDVKHIWGQGGHNGKHGAAIMPDALRWLWRDYPEPITASPHEGGERRTDLKLSESSWEEVAPGHSSIEALASNAAGELFFCDSKAGRIYRLGDDGKTRIFKDQAGRINDLACGADGNLYAIKDGKQIVRFDEAGSESLVLEKVNANALCTVPGGFYYADPTLPGVYFCTYQGESKLAARLTQSVRSLAVSADKGFMHLIPSGRFSLHAAVAANAELQHVQSYGFLELPYATSESRVTGAACDKQGMLFVCSAVGVQVLDQLGRVHLILSRPTSEPLTGLAFGGPNQSMLYVASGASIYRRKLATQGAASFAPATALPKPRL